MDWIHNTDSTPYHLQPSVRVSESNNTLSSVNLSIHDSSVKEVKETLDLDQTTMIGKLKMCWS